MLVSHTVYGLLLLWPKWDKTVTFGKSLKYLWTLVF